MSSGGAKISVACTSCGKALKAPAEWAGKMIKCPGCGSTFRIGAGPGAGAGGPRPAGSTVPQKVAPEKRAAASSRLGTAGGFVEDRKGKAEAIALGAGMGLALLGAGLALGLWWVIGTALGNEARWFSMIAGPIIGLGMWLGYRKSDVMMGVVAAILAIAVCVGGRYMIYRSVINTVFEDESPKVEYQGVRLVMYEDLLSQRLEQDADYQAASDELVKAMFEDKKSTGYRKAKRDIETATIRVSGEVSKEIDALSDADIKKKLIEDPDQAWKSALESMQTEENVNKRGYAMDNVPGYAYDEESKRAEEYVANYTEESARAEYMKRSAAGWRESLVGDKVTVDQQRAALAGTGPIDEAAAREAHTKALASMTPEDLWLETRAVYADLIATRPPEEDEEIVDEAAGFATGLSFMSMSSLIMIGISVSGAFAAATGGKFSG